LPFILPFIIPPYGQFESNGNGRCFDHFGVAVIGEGFLDAVELKSPTLPLRFYSHSAYGETKGEIPNANRGSRRYKISSTIAKCKAIRIEHESRTRLNGCEKGDQAVSSKELYTWLAWRMG
jgi:hypothetical protein